MRKRSGLTLMAQRVAVLCCDYDRAVSVEEIADAFELPSERLIEWLRQDAMITESRNQERFYVSWEMIKQELRNRNNVRLEQLERLEEQRRADHDAGKGKG